MSTAALDFEKLLRVPYVDPYSGVTIAPGGKRVAFSWNQTGQWEIYQLDLERPGAPQQLTGGPGGKFAPRYSPDGDRLAYVLDLDGGEAFDAVIYAPAQGRHTNLTPDTPFALQQYLSWSPDGSQIAFASNQSGFFEVYVMPVTGGSTRQIFRPPGPAWAAHWSPDGRWLAVVCESRGQDTAIFIVPSQGGEAIQLDLEGRLLNAREPSWSPDGSRLAFSSDAHGVYNIATYEIVTRQVAWVTSGEGEKTAPHWSPDGQRLAYVLSRGPDTWLAVHELGGAAPEIFQVEPGVHYGPRFTPDGRALVFIFGNSRRPEDVWLFTLADHSLRQLTHSLPDDLPPESLVIPSHVEYASLDGQSVPALLFQPAKTENLPPAVVVIHGGPTWLFGYLWYPLFQHMVSRGWVVLAPNYRGSTGYGRAWQLANRFDIGRGDMMDVVAGADFLVREGLADVERIAVTGRSHGGYLTMSCLTQYPERWAAGSAVVPFLNWFTGHANSREDLQYWDIENMGDPEENRELWHERSPFFYLERVQAPVQLICSTNDPRCPASESIAARDALQALGKPVDFILYPDEGHALLKIENVIDAEVRRVAFLAQALERPSK